MELLNVKLEAVDALNVELRIEKEWRQKLQAETMAEREKDMEARMEVARLRLLEEARLDHPLHFEHNHSYDVSILGLPCCKI